MLGSSDETGAAGNCDMLAENDGFEFSCENRRRLNMVKLGAFVPIVTKNDTWGTFDWPNRPFDMFELQECVMLSSSSFAVPNNRSGSSD